VPAGKDPHTFELSARDLSRLTSSSAIFTTGMSFESAVLEKLRGMGLRMRVCDMVRGIKKVPLERRCHERHECGGHHHEDGEDEDSMDPHVWLSLANLRVMAENTLADLKALRPEDAAAFDANFKRLAGEMDAAKKDVERILEPFKGRTFLVFHPAFGYFARENGLRQEYMEVEGKSPSPKGLAGIIESAKKHSIRVVFVQPQFDTKQAEALASAIKGAVEPLDDLGEDAVGNIRKMAETVAKGLSK